ncbi:MAG: sulfatase-like hydrolase/transferase [Dysgonamonadaceae bacterium]|jgi:phosphoglycerol transferase MdoB-like AlkP superfamily enzyme|nr:sulfatase-like hydrolase/transferase [Dysgonamonadaceae bacterium]
MKHSRYTLLWGFFLFFWVASFLVRTALLVWSFSKAGLSFGDLAGIYLKGFVFDTATAVFFSLPYALYAWLLPQKLVQSALNRWLTFGGFFLAILIIMFSFFAEFPFWEEYESRFNFIAVDYLIYTYEVVNNINQSYPLPALIAGMLALTAGVMYLFHKFQWFQQTFRSHTSPAARFVQTGALVAAGVLFAVFLPNSFAETGTNRYKNELSKAGIFSFFSAFKNNELDYYAFYRTEKEDKIFAVVREELSEPEVGFLSDDASIRRIVHSADSLPQKPNIILVVIESFSADFMGSFGNTENHTPFIDSLARNSLLFTDLYATGTRTVRGMEALTLCIPPTPGHSIVRRPGNRRLFNIGTVFQEKGYRSAFIYGGDGYFDNMNAFFGNNGFDIIDRGRKMHVGEQFSGTRTTIPDSEVHFENAWGICDEDIYQAAIRDADGKHRIGHPFFQFVMTTSNHRPYTYPEGKIDIPSGSGRAGAVKYTDYALGQFIREIRQKPWFENTVVMVVADHCASSAGKNEIDVSKYHIPCLIYNLKGDYPATITEQCSQIDVFPTLFALLGWSYESNFFGRNVLSGSFSPRAFVGTYQQLGYLQNDSLLILSPQQRAEMYRVSANKTELTVVEQDSSVLDKAISYYQTACWLFKNGGMKE